MDSADFDQLTRSVVTRDAGGSPMDTDRFDALARSLTTGRSRRGAVRLLAAGTLSGAAALLRGQDTTARCRSSRRCGLQNCCPKGQICGDKASQTCVTGKGTCSAGDNRCDDPTKMCNDYELCGCLPTKEGKTRCVSLLTLGSCCGKDADCAESHPDVPGAVCMAPSDCNTDCQTNPSGSNGQCYAPCPQLE